MSGCSRIEPLLRRFQSTAKRSFGIARRRFSDDLLSWPHVGTHGAFNAPADSEKEFPANRRRHQYILIVYPS